jgi:hypothetical protein
MTSVLCSHIFFCVLWWLPDVTGHCASAAVVFCVSFTSVEVEAWKCIWTQSSCEFSSRVMVRRKGELRLRQNIYLKFRKWRVRNCKLMSKCHHYGYVSYSRISCGQNKCCYRKIWLVLFYPIKWCNILVLWVDQQQLIAVRFGNYSWQCSLAEQK